MAKIEDHELSLKVAALEGGKTQVNIAQIKEIIKIMRVELGGSPEYKASDLLTWLGR